MLINQWGLASGADVKLHISYEISYTLGIQPENAVNWRLLGLNFEERNKTFEWDIPGEGGPGSAVMLQHDYDWGPVSGKTVFSWGHIHIGAINTTLYDISDPSKPPQVVCVSIPKYAPTGYITSIERRENIHTFPKNGKFRITSYYDNSKNYKAVMSLTGTYTTLEGSSEDGDSDIRRRELEENQHTLDVLKLFGSTLELPL